MATSSLGSKSTTVALSGCRPGGCTVWRCEPATTCALVSIRSSPPRHARPAARPPGAPAAVCDGPRDVGLGGASSGGVGARRQGLEREGGGEAGEGVGQLVVLEELLDLGEEGGGLGADVEQAPLDRRAVD